MNPKTLCQFGAFATGFLFISCASQKPVQATSSHSPAAARAIRSTNKMFGVHYGNLDASRVAGLYSKDAALYPPNMPKFEGQEAIQGFFKAMMGAGIAGVKLTTTDLVGDANWMSESGVYTLKNSPGDAVDQGKYVVVWKKEDGQWKMYRDIFNSDKPAPSPAKK